MASSQTALPGIAVSSTWPVAGPSYQGKKQRSRDSKEARMTEKQQLIFTSRGFKTEAEPQPHHTTQRASTPMPSEIENHGAPGESEQTLPKLLITLTGTETEGSEHD